MVTCCLKSVDDLSGLRMDGIFELPLRFCVQQRMRFLTVATVSCFCPATGGQVQTVDEFCRPQPS